MSEKRESLEERIARLEKNFQNWNRFWKERVVYISVIVALIIALITTLLR